MRIRHARGPPIQIGRLFDELRLLVKSTGKHLGNIFLSLGGNIMLKLVGTITIFLLASSVSTQAELYAYKKGTKVELRNEEAFICATPERLTELLALLDLKASLDNFKGCRLLDHGAKGVVLGHYEDMVQLMIKEPNGTALKGWTYRGGLLTPKDFLLANCLKKFGTEELSCYNWEDTENEENP